MGLYLIYVSFVAIQTLAVKYCDFPVTIAYQHYSNRRSKVANLKKLMTVGKIYDKLERKFQDINKCAGLLPVAQNVQYF